MLKNAFVLGAVVVAATAALPARAAPPACGSYVTANLTLDGNMNCPAGAALRVATNDVVIDGAGFTITGGANSTGIDIEYARRVTVKNAAFVGVGTGIRAAYTSDLTVVDADFSGSTGGSGVYMVDTVRTTLRRLDIVSYVGIGGSNNDEPRRRRCAGDHENGHVVSQHAS